MDVMLSDMQRADTIYRPTHFWLSGVHKLVADIHREGINNFRSQKNILLYFVPLYALPKHVHAHPIAGNQELRLNDNKRIATKEQLLLDHFLSGEMQAFSDYRVFVATLSDRHPFNDRASESTVGSPVEQFIFDGKRYSRSFLNYLLGLNFLKKHCDVSEIQTVLEIGGGFGSLGEILLGDERNHCFYIDIDIPPTSYIATYYLQEVFGAKSIGTYERLRLEEQLNIAALQRRYRGMVLCPWQLPKLIGTIDLFVNFISFQEMEPKIVNNYLQQVDRLQAKYLLLRNLREGKQKAKGKNNSIGVLVPIKGEDYDSFLPNYQLVATNTVPFGYKTVDNFHSELRIYQRRT